MKRSNRQSEAVQMTCFTLDEIRYKEIYNKQIFDFLYL